jgi:hypothetical protein
MLEEADLLEPRQLRADRGRAPRHVLLLGEPLGADRLVELAVSFDELAEEKRLAGGQSHTSIVAKD